MNQASLASNGHASKSNAATPGIKRKKPTNDPFFKGPKRSLQSGKIQANGHSAPITNGHPPSNKQIPRVGVQTTARATSPEKLSINQEERVSGFSDPRVTAEGIQYRDYKLVTTKRDLLDGLRYHLLHIATDKPIDIRNESDFAKPARLHRRDPKAAPPGQFKDEPHEHKDGLNPVEREEMNKRKEARQKEREANLAQIAPSQAAGKRSINFKKKTQQVFRPDFSEQDKRRIQTNYEEKLPWHLEDFDNKHCLVSQNQSGSTGVYAALAYETAADGTSSRFRLIPVEKVYQFRPKREALQSMSIEEVEAAMKKRGTEPEWLIRQQEARLAEASKEIYAKRSKGLFLGAQQQSIAGRAGEEADLDFEDDFADDEEGDLFEDKDEDVKLAEKRIKEDQLQANFLDFKDLKEYDEAEEREKKEAEARKKNFKDLRKALERRERNYNHGSDSDYESSTDSSEERDRLEKEKVANQKKEEEVDGKKSTISSSGANTPSGRKEKIAGTASDREIGFQKSSSTKSLKRPGSPNISDASGTDASSRKKKPKTRHISSTQPTPGPSRPHSPANAPPSSAPQSLDPSSAATMRISSKKRRQGTMSTAGSDTDVASDRDGAGAMSDGTKAARRLKLKMSGSPPPGIGNLATTTSQPASRAASPPPAPVAFPTAQDIKDAIPPEGIFIKDLMKVVAHPKERRQDFVLLVREVARMDKTRGVVILK